jgi:hypothetical protein
MGMKRGDGLSGDFLAITYIFFTIVFLIISTSSCNDSKRLDKKNNRIDEVKYKSQLTWMGHYEPSEKSRHRLLKKLNANFG